MTKVERAIVEFMRDETTALPGARINSTDLYNEFRTRRPGWRSTSHVLFSKQLTRSGYRKINSNGIYFLDIAMRETIVAETSNELATKPGKLKRQVYLALEDYYDDATKRYREGHTDKSVAAEIGCAEAFVKSIRDADFGPISPPDAFGAIRVEIDRLTSDLAKLRSSYDQLCNRNGWIG